jgi:hypothetical protein
LTKGKRKVTKIERKREKSQSYKKGRSKSQRYSKGERKQRYDFEKGSIKIKHTSRRSKLMNYLLHLYVH